MKYFSEQWTSKGNATCNGINRISTFLHFLILNYTSAPTLISSFLRVGFHIYFYRVLSIFSEYTLKSSLALSAESFIASSKSLKTNVLTLCCHSPAVHQSKLKSASSGEKVNGGLFLLTVQYLRCLKKNLRAVTQQILRVVLSRHIWI